MCYNKVLEQERAGAMTPNEERALMEAARLQEALRCERLAHDATRTWARRCEDALNAVRAALDDPCSDCPKWERCTAECAVIDVLREVLRR